jgi:renalase
MLPLTLRMSQKELLIIGAGLTGSLTANLLTRAPTAASTVSSSLKPPGLGISVSVWDKARGAGGRMTTHRHPTESSLHVDMGAQYISRFQPSSRGAEYDKMKEELYDELLASQVLMPFSGTIEGERKDLTKAVVGNYVAPQGINSVVKHFLSNSKAQVNFQNQLAAVDLDRSTQPSKVVCTATDGAAIKCDTLVLTMPVPQILSLGGNLVESIDPGIKEKLQSVRYSSRYALGLFYSATYSTDSDYQVPKPIWSAKYFDDPIVRFASWGLGNNDATAQPTEFVGRTLLVHTGVPFSIEHLDDDKSAVKELILKKLNTLIPDLPHASYSHLVRWRYSQVSQAYPGTPGCVVLSRQPLVVATGDGFSGSNFENCIWSAMSTLKVID